MIRIIIERRCYVCGDMTSHKSGLCLNCRSHSSLIVGKVCSKCGIPLISEIENCLRCRKMNYHFNENHSLFLYADQPKDVFYQYKFRKHRNIAYWYCEIIADRITTDFQDYLVVPSPYRYFKKIKKGWDQIQCICCILKKNHGIKTYSLLKRISGKDQKLLDLEDRRKNLRGSILWRKKNSDITGLKILLIDDVFTTGATADECARILKENGAEEVSVLTIAID